MIQLYFEDQKVDLTENLEIPMTYENIDLGAPEATLNNYSKTVTIYGTPSNNKLLGSIYRFDKSILEGDSLVGVTFDPNKRVEYTLLNNGVLFDRGYFKLDKINVKNRQVSYDLTLYGGLGNFFYSLLYAEDGSDLNLGSLYYGIDGMTKNEENTKPLFEYNKDFVNTAWNNRMSDYLFGHIPDTDSRKMFCPIPTYSGYYDDFKSDTILYDTKWFNDEAWKDKIVDSDKTYTTKKRWIKIQTPRELTEWEIGDIRSHYQRLGIRLKNIYEAIKNPENNGGFTVDDSKVQDIEKQYIENGYLMLNRFDYEDINSTYIDTTIDLQVDRVPQAKYSYDYATTQKFDVSDYLNPNGLVNILPELYVEGSGIPDYILLNRCWVKGWWTMYGSNGGWLAKPSTKLYVYLNYQYFFAVTYDERGNIETVSDVYFYSGNSAGTDMQLDYPCKAFYENVKADIEAQIKSMFNLYSHNVRFNYTFENAGYDLETQSTSTQKKYLGKKTIPIQVPLTKNSKRMRIYTGVIFGYYYRYVKDANSIKQYTGNACYAYNEKFTQNWQCTSVANISNSTNARSAIYDGDFSDEGDRHVLNKAAIFADTPSPYDFLLSLGKMFNWKFEQDILNSKIMIYSSKNYYNGVTRLIEEDLDRSVYNIIPCTAEYKCYDFGHELPDTYAKNLWNLKYNENYGQHHLKTSYEFSKEHHNIHEDSEFQTVIPWKLTSVYFNPEQYGWPKSTLGSTFTATLWNDEGDTKETRYTGFIGLTKIPEGKTKISQNKQDVFAKVCCFDKDNSSVDISKAIVYFDSYRTYTQDSAIYQLSDNIPICKELCDQNCYYYNYGWSSFASMNSVEERVTAIKIGKIPVFSNKFFYINENYFGTYETPLTDTNLVEDKTNTYPSHNLFELCFKFQFEDLYNKNNKVLNIKYRLREHPKAAMRKFYYFDNATWILNKIDNYTPGFNNFTNCQFIKIQDKNNYVQ